MSEAGTPGSVPAPADPAPGRDDPVPERALDGGDGLPGDALTDAQLEALLFVAERPLTRRELVAITGASADVIDARLGDLQVGLATRGIRLLVDAERVALGTAPEAGRLIGRYVGRDPARLSPATLETLAIVAYRQPATKSTIERIRGVDADYAIRSLVHRRLVVELGRSEAPGRPILYGTGVEFLERFGLTSLDDLPVVDAAVAQRLAVPEADAVDARDALQAATDAHDALFALAAAEGASASDTGLPDGGPR